MAGQNEIRRRAHKIYLERGERPGGELDDWLRAEREFNKPLVLEALDTLFNQRDYVNAERYWPPNYIQHSAHIKPGREGLLNILGRYSGMGLPVNWVVADIFRIRDDVLAEHWDVIQNEATKDTPRVECPFLGTSSRSDLARRSKGRLIARREGFVAGPPNHLTEISRNPTRRSCVVVDLDSE